MSNLYDAIQKRNILEVMLLLPGQWNKDPDGNDWKTPLIMMLCEYDMIECIPYAISFGADINEKAPGTDVAAIHSAIRKTDISCLQILLDHGADTYALYAANNPAIFAINISNIEALDLILSTRKLRGDDIPEKERLLYEAIHADSYFAVQLILECMPDINKYTDSLETSLMKAIQMSDIKIIEELLKYGADANICDRYDRNALYIAILERREDVIKLLLKSKVDINKQDNNGNTPVHRLVSSGLDKKLIGKFISVGANILLPNKTGLSVFDMVVEKYGTKYANTMLSIQTADSNSYA